MNTELNLEIEKLVLEGLDLTPGEQREFKDAVTQALSNLFATNGLPGHLRSLGSAPRLLVPTIRLSKPVVPPAQLGEQVGHALYTGLKGND